MEVCELRGQGVGPTNRRVGLVLLWGRGPSQSSSLYQADCPQGLLLSTVKKKSSNVKNKQLNLSQKIT